MGHLEAHQFWSSWGRMDLRALVSFCSAAVESSISPQGDIVFEDQRPASEMFIVAAGELSYAPGPMAVESQLHLGEESIFRVNKGMWCVEIALWVKWVHAGTMQTACTSELLRVNISRWRPSE